MKTEKKQSKGRQPNDAHQDGTNQLKNWNWSLAKPSIMNNYKSNLKKRYFKLIHLYLKVRALRL